MHASHLTAFVNGFLSLAIPMQAKGATTWDILLAMSEMGHADMGTVGADAIICRVRSLRDRQRAGMDFSAAPDVYAMVHELIAAEPTGIAPTWA